MTQPPDQDDPPPAPAPTAGPAPATPAPAGAAVAASRGGFARRPAAEPDALDDPHTRPVLAAYVLLIGVVLTLGAAIPLVLFLAWRGREGASDWLKSHYLYLLRTALVTAGAGLAGLIMVPIGLGVFILTLTAVWCVIRGAAGLPRLMKGRPIDQPRTWSLP